ncbi:MULTISPECIES: isoprenyl transferase [Paraclostridium]|uniref:Isoprenyl transferase n=2 Tax=Paraclostridium bifermentans TaxID=1490 RepID=A0A1X2JIF4_PARBF|nr:MULTISPECIES: isoprenyl transferase [Paraclostridium]KGJ50027.1 UDP pyrophosphate synthase [Clostridium sp. NCR]MCU9808406.1 isoprenyl transferase [Paraclostridium sp. AKS46]MDM8128634.1 isoprenyl transferase [Paraclostridium benzoelyticum]MDV8108948.1 isoprenyl transferase [Bacillus sp. BAU-SS-2023]EQK43510.1 di-trans,poly-cis-decaprenylcistransferase [[Clostridium] bifermentans ATCC 638] [Paraclostridium bifermentans ATCC 638 = DSM 14991]
MNKNTIYDINLSNVPTHIAIIMDGNGRWAKERLLPRTVGHKAGVEAIRAVTKECSALGVKHLTLYAFSTENWKRPKLEVDALMNLLYTYLNKELKELHKNNVKITTIGDIDVLPGKSLDAIKNAIDITKDNTGLNLNIALNYGSRNDIKNAVVDIVKNCKSGKIDIEDITEDTITKYLSTKSIPDPDLIIRTSGEQRISNFLLWEIAYSEFYFTDVYWPDFDGNEVRKAIYVYQSRDRRFGGLK